MTPDALPPCSALPDLPGMLAGVRVVEYGDELGEYCGLLLAGLGADVIRVEGEGGAPTRRIGPFLGDRNDREMSLHFWNFNRGKRSVVLDVVEADDRERFNRLLGSSAVLLDSSGPRLRALLEASYDNLESRFPGLVIAQCTPFGETGPWKDYCGSDLVHLALGGVMMSCGYDATPEGEFDLPPIAPQAWHAYHIAGEQLAIGVIAALVHRLRTGEGQQVSCAVHEAVAKNTELDLMSYIMRKATFRRQTCRHASETPDVSPNIAHTKDGRWVITYFSGVRDERSLVPFLESYGMAADLDAPPPDAVLTARKVPGSAEGSARASHILDVVQRFVRKWTYANLPWRKAQDEGLIWAPLRKPHESLFDHHWLKRGAFCDIEHPELGRSFRYPVSKWRSTATSWQAGRRAPLVGEHTLEVLAEVASGAGTMTSVSPGRASQPVRRSRHGKPFPLQGVRILDFGWFLASAGGTRFAVGLGADSIKVEWKGIPDTRLSAMAPVGGRAARESATGPLPGVTDPDMGGQFLNKNSGKRGLSLNLRDPRGLAIAKELVRVCDVVAEGFSPGVLDRLGLGYEVLKSIRPDIIYVQQSGMGAYGEYGRFRTLGPIAAAFTGLSEMSGLPEPAMPVGWGYSYLDWAGAYSFALALVGALYHRDRTGEGQWIDASQCEPGIALAGTSILDWQANGRIWQRYGNRSPYKRAAPHGAFRCDGVDRWIAIACFTEEQWHALARVAARPEWLHDRRFASLDDRLGHADALESAVTTWTLTQERYRCMDALQAAGVPAGVCQTAEDRCDNDPQLRALEWLTEITGTRIGTWPVPEMPVKLSKTPSHVGGVRDIGAPGYGEHNEQILGEFLGMSKSDVRKLAEDGVI